MKKNHFFTSILLTILAFLSCQMLVAQEDKSQGMVEYQMRIYSPPIFNRLSENAQNKLPDSITDIIHVYFGGNWVRYEDTTLYAKQKKEGEIAYKSSEAGWLVNYLSGEWFLMHQFDGKIYYGQENIKSNSWRFTVSLKDHYDGPTTKYQRQIYKMNDAKELKITEETKMILGHKCKKAVYSTGISSVDGSGDKGEIVVWFTDELKNHASPIPQNIIDGAVLEATFHRITYKATDIKYFVPNREKLAIPVDGTKLTVDEEEKMTVRYISKK
jgi:GLPGLI family protein